MGERLSIDWFFGNIEGLYFNDLLAAPTDRKDDGSNTLLLTLISHLNISFRIFIFREKKERERDGGVVFKET